MSRRSTKILKTVLDTLYYTKGYKALAPITQGVGAIFTLHQVDPAPIQDFEPNRILKVSPDFLEQVIDGVLEAGYDVISLDEAHWRLQEGEFERSFVCFTFDDGYRDNWEHAYPIFRQYDLPFAIYVPCEFADGRGDLWWLALEHLIRDNDRFVVRMHGEDRVFECATIEDKDATYHTVYWWLRGLDETEARGIVADLCRSVGFDQQALCETLMMDWQEIKAIANDPLVTIGGHTKGHFALSRLSLAQARFQVEENLARLEHELGTRPTHFSFPYGCEQSAGPREFALLREMGMKTAVTTRKGLIYAEHYRHLTALPRVSLNGDYQDMRYLTVLLSGAPFVVWNRFRKIDAA
ncbi:MAG: polysaccharide deacetylase family protein [Hyphomicrobiaceae bacterium]